LLGPCTLRCAPLVDCSSLDTWFSQHPADCSAFRLVHPVLLADLTRRSTLDARRRLQIAPLPAICVRVAHRIAPWSTLRALHRSRIAPLPMLVRRACCGLLRPLRFAPRCRPRIDPPGLLRLNRSCFGRLTLRDGLRIAPYADTLHPRIDHGFLRARHFKLRPVHRLLCARRLALASDCRSLRFPFLAPWCCPRIAPCTTLGVLHPVRLAPRWTLITPHRI
jgi:hypothetical protein